MARVNAWRLVKLSPLNLGGISVASWWHLGGILVASGGIF
jgi:hypothetical protein